MPVLTTSGSPTFNGDGSCTIDSTGSDIVQGPSNLLNPAQMWFAARVRIGFASTDVTNHRFFTWGPDTNSELFIEWTTSSQVGTGRDKAGSGGEQQVIPGAFSINTDHTVVGTWTATLTNVSWDGAAFAAGVSNTNTDTPVGNRSVFDIGCRAYTPANWGPFTYWWVAAGTGTLADADAATLNAFGNTDPTLDALPGNPTFLWTCDDTSFQPVYAPAHTFNAIPFT